MAKSQTVTEGMIEAALVLLEKRIAEPPSPLLKMYSRRDAFLKLRGRAKEALAAGHSLETVLDDLKGNRHWYDDLHRSSVSETRAFNEETDKQLTAYEAFLLGATFDRDRMCNSKGLLPYSSAASWRVRSGKFLLAWIRSPTVMRRTCRPCAPTARIVEKLSGASHFSPSIRSSRAFPCKTPDQRMRSVSVACASTSAGNGLPCPIRSERARRKSIRGANCWYQGRGSAEGVVVLQVEPWCIGQDEASARLSTVAHVRPKPLLSAITSSFPTRSSALKCVYRLSICMDLWPLIADTPDRRGLLQQSD